MNDNRQNASAANEPPWGLITIISFGVVIVIFVAIAAGQYLFVERFVSATDGQNVARFGISGDFFGLANAIFSSLAFAAIIVTLWMQKYELKQQRLELQQTQEIMELQRQEMQDQKKEMHEQNESLRRQRFENTFFRMLELHNENVASISIPGSSQAGRAEIANMVAKIIAYSLQDKPNIHQTRPEEIKIVTRYEAWYSNYESSVGHYFRTLYNILRYIDEFGGEERVIYSRLVRAQLSSKELELLAVNGMSKHGAGTRRMIEKYALLKHLIKSEPFNELRAKYAPSAFEQEESA